MKGRRLRLLGMVLVLVALLLGLYTLAAYLGWQSGEDLRAQRVSRERQEQIETQMTRAREEIEGGNYRLALRRLDWVLEQDPTYPGARGLYDVAQMALGRDSTPLATGPESETPLPSDATPTGTRVTDGEEDEAPAQARRRLERLVEEEAWQEAIGAIIVFQNSHPNYERRQTDALLFEAYIGRGVELLYTDRVELGIYYLSQAQELGDLPADVQDQRQWAELYLAGIAYFGVNWNVAISNFRDLCLAAPFYQDSCVHLREALISAGDQYTVQAEWCPAESYYREAYQIDEGAELEEKLEQARTGCLEATPTPAAPITPTIPTTSTTPITETFPFTAP